MTEHQIFVVIDKNIR